MAHLLSQTLKYIIVLLFAFYTLESFVCLNRGMTPEKAKKHYKRQVACMILFMIFGYIVIFVSTLDWWMWVYLGAQILFFIYVFIIYRVVYKRAAPLVVNHMCMLMAIGFMILWRLKPEEGMKQFSIAVIGFTLTILIPLFIHKIKALRKITWFYGIFGILAIGVVWVAGKTSYGAKLSFSIAGFSLQPSEFIKIIFVFFVACLLYENVTKKKIIVATIMALIHVGILVLSKDLGAALIFFVTYFVMLYVATRKAVYLLGGLGIGAVSGFAAAKIFSHVKTRIIAWQDPFGHIDKEGYQICRSLFAIGTGGWFGMGLCQGMPESIPVVDEDFIFSAISEELGGVFAVCLIMVCCSCFIMFLNISLQIRDQFYKLLALGLGTVYGTQVLLNIGGVTKFIPLTGVTLPLISHGGSSLLSTLVIFAIIQGLYILREKEGEEDEKRRQEMEEIIRQERELRGRSGEVSGRGRNRRVSRRGVFEETDLSRGGVSGRSGSRSVSGRGTAGRSSQEDEIKIIR